MIQQKRYIKPVRERPTAITRHCATCTCGQPLPSLAGPGQVGKNYPDTSKEAAYSVEFENERFDVLLMFSQFDMANTAMVADRLVLTDPRLNRNRSATRVGELRKLGFLTYALDADGKIVRLPTNPPGTPGKKFTGRAYVVTAVGHAKLAEVAQQ